LIENVGRAVVVVGLVVDVVAGDIGLQEQQSA